MICKAQELVIGNHRWYFQKFLKKDRKTLEAVRLYNEIGDYVAEFASMGDLMEFVNNEDNLTAIK